MRTTIDSAGRLVIPKAVRDEVGLRPGPVEVSADGSSVRIEPDAGAGLEEEDGWLVVPATGRDLTDDDVRALRRADQR